MPVRVPEIPQLQGTRINAPTMSAAAAAAPARALGSLASALAQVSQPFERIAERVQQNENAYALSNARNQLDIARNDFLLDLEKENDPAARLTRTQEFLQDQKGIAENPEHAPQVRDRLIPYFDVWATDLRNNVAGGAARLSERRAGLALQAEVDSAFQNNNEPQLEQALQAAVESNILLPEQADAQRAEFADKQRIDQTTRSIHADPVTWLEDNPEPPSEGSLTEWNNNTRLATTLLRHETAETTDTVLDLMAAGKIKDEAHLEELTANLRPAAQAQLKNSFARRQAAEYEATRKTPAFQNQITGQVRAAIRDYEPSNPDTFDEQGTAIAGLIDELPPGPTKTELNRIFKAKRDATFQQFETNADQAHDALGKAWEAGSFGRYEDTLNVSAALDAGLLTDETKLRAAGFSEDQIKAISDDDLSKTARTALFRKEWHQRPNLDEAADPLSRATMEALAAGETTAYHIDFNAKDKAEARYGAATRKLDVFLAANPDKAKDWNAVKEFLQTIEDETEVEGITEQLIEPFDYGTGVLPPLSPTATSDIGIPPP